MLEGAKGALGESLGCHGGALWYHEDTVEVAWAAMGSLEHPWKWDGVPGGWLGGVTWVSWGCL